MTVARRFAVVLAALVWGGFSAGGASSALFFLFEPTAVAAGQAVTIRTAGTPLGFDRSDRVLPLQRPIRVYLVRNAIAGEIRSRLDPRLHFVGRLFPDARGRASLTFAAPPLDTGDYAVAAWCPGCARYSGGSTFSVLQVDEQIVPRYRRPMRLTLRTTVTPQSCPVTHPDGSSVYGSYGNGLLSTWLSPSGIMSRPREADGSIFNKLPWVPTRGGANQRLAVRGERLDEPSPPMRVRVNWGYDSTGKGSWMSAVWFPSEGCWRLTGRVGDVSLTYVVQVGAA